MVKAKKAKPGKASDTVPTVPLPDVPATQTGAPTAPDAQAPPTAPTPPAPENSKAATKGVKKDAGKKKDKNGPKKKKLSKKEKARLALELAEQQRQEQERERMRMIQEEKEQIELDRLAAERKALRDVIEQELRQLQLQLTLLAFQKYMKPMNEMLLNERRNEEWTQYLKCDGLPDPASLSQMNTYLYLWRLDDSVNEIEAAIHKTDEVLGLLNVLEELIDVPLDVTPEYVEDWKELRNTFRVEQQAHLDAATYRLLRVMETNLTLIGLNEVRYQRQTQHFKLCLWTLLPLPRPVEPPDARPKPLKQCNFEELGLSLQMPESLGNVNFAVRALQLDYNHFSDMCPSWDSPVLPEEHNVDLVVATIGEWNTKVGLEHIVNLEMEKRTKQRRVMLAQAQASHVSSASGPDRRSENKTPPKSADKGSQPESDYAAALQQIQQLPPVKTTSDLFREAEDAQEAELREHLLYESEPGELNLRRFCILGGVLHLDLLEQLPQPHELPEKYIITVLNIPHQLELVNFHVQYTPPPPPEPGQRRLPEEIEAEMKKQEEALDKLPLVNILLPETVLWFEPPTVARWDEESGFWSTADCHDFKFNEDKQILTFRLGRFGPLGLAAYRYCNLPYQTWELKPDLKSGGVLLNITAAVMIVEFTIKEDRVCLSQLQNGATLALQDIVGTFYKPHVLMKLMCRGGVDLFPAHDAFCYVEGAAPKHRATEDHLYQCMAMMVLAFNFAWSRWNLLAGRRNIILQMREYLDRRHLPNHSMLHVTPLKTTIVDCTEVAQSFNETGVPEMKFCSDLYHLAQIFTSPGARRKIADTPFTLVQTTFEMLRHTRVLSYS